MDDSHFTSRPYTNHCTLAFSQESNIFCMTLWLMMLGKHTKFDNKMLCGSEDMHTNIHKHFEPRCDLHLECSNPIFS